MPVETSLRGWRPQRFGRRSARFIGDPIVEPVWPGIRVLAHASPREAEFVDAAGRAQAWPDVAARLLAAVRADAVVLDGYLTPDGGDQGVGAMPGLDVEPRVLDVGRRLFGVGNDRRQRELEAVTAIERPTPIAPGTIVAFVAVDLIALDGEPLLDVPLLERKRLLDGVLGDDPLVRRGMHVRPPIRGWVATWKSLGFRAIAYKSVNSRYRPGEPNDEWATAPIPVR